MCWFVTLAVPPGAPLPESDRWLGIVSKASDGFPPGWATFEARSGLCACGLYEPPTAGPTATIDQAMHLRERYRRRGWSAAKIERALQNRTGAAPRRAERDRLPLRFREQMVAWAGRYGPFCILAHWAGGPNEEALKAQPMINLSAARFLRDSFPPETLVRVHGMTQEGFDGSDVDA